MYLTVLIIFEKKLWMIIKVKNQPKVCQKPSPFLGKVKVSGAFKAASSTKSKVLQKKTLMKKRDVVLWPDKKNSCTVLTTTFCSPKKLDHHSWEILSGHVELWRCCQWAKTILNSKSGIRFWKNGRNARKKCAVSWLLMIGFKKWAWI